jgi:4-hydroxybenzoate polyprenyltransferase
MKQSRGNQAVTKTKFELYWQLMRFDKPIGILLLLWPALWSLWIAGAGRPDVLVTIVIVLGVILMRAAGCVINDYADRDIDPHVQRTQSRPIASGQVSPTEALILFAGLCLTAFALVLLLNWMTIMLSFFGVILAASYPFMKRYTYFPQAYLGLAFGWAVPMSFAAQTQQLPEVAWLLYLATLFWALAYDTMYALADRDEDMAIGVKSTAILFGGMDRIFIALFQVFVLLLLYGIGDMLNFKWPYYMGLLVATALCIYQQYLIRHRQPAQSIQAFLNNNWFGMVVFVGLVIQYWL